MKHTRYHDHDQIRQDIKIAVESNNFEKVDELRLQLDEDGV